MALKRYAKPEEMASFVAYLASLEASFITGATLRPAAEPEDQSWCVIGRLPCQRATSHEREPFLSRRPLGRTVHGLSRIDVLM